MPLLKNKALILAKIEATRGTDAAPLAASNAILCEAPEIEIVSQSLERNYVTPYLGSKKRLNIGEGLKIRFATEAKGGGAAGTAPPIGCLFQACGFTETVIPATSVTYNPNSDIFATASASVTIWFYLDGIVHKAVGCVGTFSMDIKVNFIFHRLSSYVNANLISSLPASVVKTSGNTAVRTPFLSPYLTSDSITLGPVMVMIFPAPPERATVNATWDDPLHIVQMSFVATVTISGSISPVTLRSVINHWRMPVVALIDFRGATWLPQSSLIASTTAA